MKIIDAHHHIWRQRDLPWLMGPMQPRIFGPYEPIRRDYPIEEFLRDIAGSGVERSIYVQANWAKERFEDEVAWVQRTADESGWPHAIVGYADLMAEDVRPQLDRLAKYPLMRGVRMQLHWHENAMYRFAARPDIVNEEGFRANLGRLEAYGWSFDLQVFASQMADAARLAADYPKLDFILQHAGMLQDLSETGRSQWRSGMDKLAARPNVYCKLSGLGTFLHRNDAAHTAEIARFALALFGPERCLFGSNFPIEKLWTGYGELVETFQAATAELDEPDKRSVFWGTAAKVYRVGEGSRQ